MALSLGYASRETASNLKRNLLMSVAAVLIMAVSLALVGATLLLRQGVNKQTIQWQDGVELSIFMQPNAGQTQIDAVAADLATLPEVESSRYVDQAAAYEEFKTLFASSPEMIESVTPADLPPSFRVVPVKAEYTDVIGERFRGREGVREVTYAKDVIDKLVTETAAKQRIYMIMAGVLLVSGVMLILVTIQLAIYARRREVSVMKLVGATNWFIRVPFMLEGVVQGLIGAIIAGALVYGFRNQLLGLISDSSLASTELVATSREGLLTAALLVAIGTLVGAIGSAAAVRRFLDV
jgi:cell division transport system permease protein